MYQSPIPGFVVGFAIHTYSFGRITGKPESTNREPARGYLLVGRSQRPSQIPALEPRASMIESNLNYDEVSCRNVFDP